MDTLFKYILLLLFCSFLVSCASVNQVKWTPEVADFPNVELVYQVTGTRDATRQLAISFLTDKGILYRQEIQEPHTYVITAYLPEPASDEDRRIRRTAYRVSLREDAPNSPCAYASITWLVESKGIRELTWRTVESDESYTPNDLDEVKGLFSGRGCG